MAHLHNLGRLGPITQNNPHTGTVELVNRVEYTGGAPGRVIPDATNGLTSPQEVTRAVHQCKLFQGVMDMRTKLLDSYFILIFILALPHFLTYIQLLCTL